MYANNIISFSEDENHNLWFNIMKTNPNGELQ